MTTASRTRDRGLPSGNEARRYNEDSNRATDALADMYGPQNSEKLGPGTKSPSNRRGDGRRAPNVDHHSVNSPSSTSSSTSGRSSNTSRGTARGSVNRSQELLHTTVPRRPASGTSSPLETANKHFPLNDIDYESNPAAVQQELSNLQALRRMSMDASTASDPDLPGFNLSTFTAPTGGDDDNDARRLFWVPARLHPELAPEGWKAFVEAKVKEIRSPGGQNNSLLSVGSTQGPALRRKKSMLSKQIDNTGGKAAEGYEDGAERLERRRSQNGVPMLKVSDLENLVNDPSSLLRKLSVSPAARVNVNGKMDEDLPILPPLGHTLRRSTRTTYRKERGGGIGGLGSVRRRLPRAGGETDADDYSPGNSPGSPKVDLTLKRVQTDPLPSINAADRIHSRPQDFSTAEPRQANESQDLNVRIKPTVTSPPSTAPSPMAPSAPAAPSPSTSFEDMLANSASIPPISSAPPLKSSSSKPNRRSTSPTSRPSHSRKESQDKVAPVPRIVETPPTDQAQQVKHSERTSLHHPPQTSPPRSSKRPLVRQGGSENLAGEAGSRPSSAGKESLAPASSEGKEKRAGRSDSISSSTRKSSWGWLVGDKEREKEKESKERESEKDGGSVKIKKSKVSKAEKGADKDHARLDVIQKSIDGKELQPEKGDGGRAKDKSNTQETASSKKEKESGLFSSFFGGSRKKSGSESHKAKSAQNASPEKPHVQQNFYYTRFPIHIERAIYRLSHLKLANPRRPLLQQVLLSNFMYSYLAKVQMHQPTLLQQQQQQQQQQREYEQQQLYQQQQAQYEQQHAQYEQPTEQYYQYDDVDYAEDSQIYEYEDDDQHQQPHQQYQHPPRSHSQNAQFPQGHGHVDEISGGEYEQHQYQQYYSPSQQYHQQQQHAGNGAASHRDDDMW
ncbi:hypothetical protein EV426DRAFT_159449 [Tirmania nivea]|nr:hypothetical protein EV426DRAFT_159449 [Tirmania nivea]